jgi:hypothetical protein
MNGVTESECPRYLPIGGVRCDRGAAGTVTTGRIEERSPRAGRRCDSGEEVRGAAVSDHHGHERTGARPPRGGALRRVPGRARRRGRARPACPRGSAVRHGRGGVAFGEEEVAVRTDEARPARRSRRGWGGAARPGRSSRGALLGTRVFITGEKKLSEVTDKQGKQDISEISDQIQIF